MKNILIYLLLLVYSSLIADNQPLAFIGVDSHNKIFIIKNSGKPFIPFGLNYIDPDTYPDHSSPQSWSKFNPENIKKDFKILSQAGYNIIRLPITGRYFVTHDKELKTSFKKLDFVLQEAEKNHLRVILALFIHWEGESDIWKWSDWKEQYYNYSSTKKFIIMWQKVAEYYKDNPIIMSYSLKNEAEIPWNIPIEKWITWLKIKYHNDLNAVKNSWNNPSLNSWQEIKIPPNKDNKNDQYLYDYQLFREFLSYWWLRSRVEAIRKIDKNHLITAGNIQWSNPTYRKWPPIPSGYVGFDPHISTALLDYHSIHWYPCKPDFYKSTREFIPAAALYLDAFINYHIIDIPILFEEFGLESHYDNPINTADHTKWLQTVFETSKQLTAGHCVWMYADGNNSKGRNATGLYTAKRIIKKPGEYWSSISTNATSRTIKVSGKPDYLWEIDKKTLLTWYGGSLREGKIYSDTGGYWTEEYLRLIKAGKKPAYIINGEGAEFHADIYKKWIKTENR